MKKFDAILIKNDLAREFAKYENSRELNINRCLSLLMQLEQYLGVMNQPSTQDIFNNNSKVNKKFTI
jgi:hypothetical protein